MNSTSIYESLGEDNIRLLVQNFYRNVATSTDLRNLYPENLAPAEHRLFMFLVHVFGGPSTYLEQRGHPMLRKRHFQWPIDSNMRDLWINCMFQAIDKINMDQNVREQLTSYFVKAANHMVNR